MTFGQLSVLGEDDFSAYCYRCHVNNLLGSYGYLAISHYGDAQSLLSEIAAMPPGGGVCRPSARSARSSRPARL